MAEYQDTGVSYSQLNAGDQIFDLCCTPCSKKKWNKQAAKYCVICNEYFCINCVDSHNSFQALSGHVLVDPQTTKPTSSSSRKKYHTVPTELCKKHHLKLVDMYCGNHDTVGCSVCFTLDHKSCTDIHYVPEYLSSRTSFLAADQMNQLVDKITTTIKDMSKLGTEYDNKGATLDKDKDICKGEIQNYKDDLVQIIDQIEATTLAELDERYKDKKKKIDDEKHDIRDSHDDMVRLKSEITSDQSNECQKFVCAKLSQSVMKQSQRLRSELSYDKTPEFTFARNTDIIMSLLRFVALGTLSPQVVPNSPSSASTSGESDMSSNSAASLSPSNGRQKQNETAVKLPSKQDLYEIKDVSKYQTQANDDLTASGLSSSCISGSGDILLGDYNNKKIKLMDSKTLKIVSTLSLDATPLSVSRVNDTELAVCSIDRTIQFVSNQLVLKRSLGMKHYCRCIAFTRDKMCVCNLSAVHIYTKNGELIKSISNDESGNRIFSDIWDMTLSDDEKLIHVADYTKGVITLNFDGNVVWKYSSEKLIKTRSVCTDGNNNVFVCGSSSSNVIQLGPDGQYIGEIVPTNMGMKFPQAICYDQRNRKLVVGNNTIDVYTIK